MNIQVSDDLEKRFRNAAGKKLGVKKGNIGVAFAEAMEMWIKK